MRGNAGFFVRFMSSTFHRAVRYLGVVEAFLDDIDAKIAPLTNEKRELSALNSIKFPILQSICRGYKNRVPHK